jgi:hypothetical protein
MEPETNLNTPNMSLGFCAGFVFRLVSLGLLFSLIPLIFVNLPVRILFLSSPTFFYNIIMVTLNCLAIFVCFAFAAKLLFSWGVKGYQFKIFEGNLDN